MIFKRPCISNENPWVLVDKKTNQIVKEGLFCDLVKISGFNLMSKTFYLQLMDESSK